MTSPPSSRTALQANGLVQEIERKVSEQRRELLDAATRESDQIRQRAQVKARRQLRRAIQEMRASEAQRTLQVRAELETAHRHRVSTQAAESLAATWPLLGRAVERRWADRDTRAQWLAAQIALARARLPATDWVLSHPAQWNDAEVAALRELLRDAGVAAATLRPDAGLQVGLVIEAGGVRLDSTPRALWSDRARVESALLARLAQGVSAA